MTNLAPSYDFGARACPLRPRANAPIADRPENARICTAIAGPRRVHGLQTTAAALNIFDLSGSTGAVIAAAIALVPAIVAHLRGRQIARFADDPALPERLFAGRHVTASWLIVTITALIFLTGWAAIWAVPLTVIAYVAAGLPLRRILYNETWSLAFYLSFVIRFFLAGWSFWLLVCALPVFTLWAGDRGWMVALAMAGGLTIFAGRQTEVIRWLVGAKPIADQPLRARFDRLAATAGLPSPHFELIDLKGGSFANAFALASLERGAVVFTSPLLERLDPDETDAICAHELAHLEYHNTRRLRRQRLICRSLVVGGAVLTPVVKLLVPSVLWLACTAWPLVVLIAIAVLVHDRQKHETASDLRACALTGNPEALVRALVKLHAMARVPRRWDADLERHMSHPSLKRRIQDIRAAAGTPPAALGDTAVFESGDGTARVVFGDETLEWIEGVSASYRVRYDRLSELRIAAAGTGHTSLLAADRAGHRWQMPVRVDDVARIQAVLDIIDSRVDTGPAPHSLQPVLIRAITFSVCIVSLNAGQLGVAMVVAMTLTRSEAPLLGAAGLASIAGAVLTWRDPGTMYGYIPDGFEAIFATVLLGGGALLLARVRPTARRGLATDLESRRRRRCRRPRVVGPVDRGRRFRRGWPSPVRARVVVNDCASAGARRRDALFDAKGISNRCGGSVGCEPHRRRGRVAAFSRSIRGGHVPAPRDRPEGANAGPSCQRVHRAIRHGRASPFARRSIDRGRLAAPQRTSLCPHRPRRRGADVARSRWGVVRRR